MSAEVAELSLKSDEVRLGGQRLTVAILFNAEGGVVDKYIGDSIMAVFGAPMSKGDDAGRALRAAATMQVALSSLNVRRARGGLAPLEHGIGVHLGEVIAGNIGTPERSQYTVIGDAVNVAARLEGETKKQGVAVLFSKAVVDAAASLSRPALHPVGDGAGILLKGREQPICVQTIA